MKKSTVKVSSIFENAAIILECKFIVRNYINFYSS